MAITATMAARAAARGATLRASLHGESVTHIDAAGVSTAVVAAFAVVRESQRQDLGGYVEELDARAIVAKDAADDAGISFAIGERIVRSNGERYSIEEISEATAGAEIALGLRAEHQ